MTIPDFQTLMLPVLRSSASGEVKVSDVVQRLATEFNLTTGERAELLPSGRQTTFANRVHWAKSHLGSFPEFQAFRKAGAADRDLAEKVAQTTGMTPDEMIRKAHEQLEEELGQDLLTRIVDAPSDFFEKLIVQLLIAMGYGGAVPEAGRALGKTGDDGVDGVIDQDALGLDRIYVQAKRYRDGNIVGPAAIRDFFGSLDRFKAAKGLFATTSSFSLAARQTAEFLSKRIVLIDGRLLARLMIRYNVGCRVEETIHLKKIDEDFFE